MLYFKDVCVRCVSAIVLEMQIGGKKSYSVVGKFIDYLSEMERKAITEKEEKERKNSNLHLVFAPSMLW